MPGDEILQYPAFSSGPFLVFLVLLVIVLIGLFILRLRLRRKLAADLHWNRLLAYGRKRRLDRPELRFLRHFYQGLEAAERERLMRNRPFFRESLRGLLRRRSDVAARRRVRVYQKLFPAIDYRLEIADLADLQPGELCSLVTRKRAALVRVLDNEKERARFELLDPSAPGDYPEGGSAMLFAYRPLLGEFSLNGKVYERAGSHVEFRFGGRVQARYETHFMLERALEVKLEPETRDPAELVHGNELDGLDFETGSAADGEDQAQTPEAMEANGPPELFGRTERISDRAMSLRLDRASEIEIRQGILRRVELWRVQLTLEGSYELTTAGTLYPARAKGVYIFRYRDLPEQEHQALLRFIRGAGGVRERL